MMIWLLLGCWLGRVHLGVPLPGAGGRGTRQTHPLYLLEYLFIPQCRAAWEHRELAADKRRRGWWHTLIARYLAFH